MSTILYFDGACEPRNPGGVPTYGWVIKGPAGAITSGYGVADGYGGVAATNNIAEYSALIAALEFLLSRVPVWKGELEIRGDSSLVIKQINGLWQCKALHIGALRDRCLDLLAKVATKWTANWVPREENTEADALSRKAYEEHTGKSFPERR